MGPISKSRRSDSSDGAMSAVSVFVYGTLMSERVLQVLLQRLPSRRPATLRGFSRFGVQGIVYPAMIPDAHGEVEGLLLESLSEIELKRFDAFEDDEYARETVELVDGKAAFAYVWIDHAMLTGKPWSLEKDFAPHEAVYLDKCAGFVKNNYEWK